MRSGGGNPNEQDLPDQRNLGRELGGQDSVANVWWSDRANDELRLRQMRPADLPRMESGSEAGVSVAGWREAGLEDVHPPHEDLFAEAAREMNRQTSVAGYPQSEAERFLREQENSTGLGPRSSGSVREASAVGRDGLAQQASGRQETARDMVQRSTTGSQGMGRTGVSGSEADSERSRNPVNLQELSLEQIYEALDPLSGNLLLMEMRRRIEAAEE